MNIQHITKLSNQIVPNGVCGKHRHLNISGVLRAITYCKLQGKWILWSRRDYETYYQNSGGSAPAAANSIDPFAVFCWCSEVIRNKRLNNSGGGTWRAALRCRNAFSSLAGASYCAWKWSDSVWLWIALTCFIRCTNNSMRRKEKSQKLQELSEFIGFFKWPVLQKTMLATVWRHHSRSTAIS